MKGLVITTENKMQVREFGEPAYETIGKAVGGWIEVVHPKGLPDPFCIDPIGVKHLKEVVRNESKRRQRAQQRILAGGAA